MHWSFAAGMNKASLISLVSLSPPRVSNAMSRKIGVHEHRFQCDARSTESSIVGVHICACEDVRWSIPSAKITMRSRQLAHSIPLLKLRYMTMRK